MFREGLRIGSTGGNFAKLLLDPIFLSAASSNGTQDEPLYHSGIAPANSVATTRERVHSGRPIPTVQRPPKANVPRYFRSGIYFVPTDCIVVWVSSLFLLPRIGFSGNYLRMARAHRSVRSPGVVASCWLECRDPAWRNVNVECHSAGCPLSGIALGQLLPLGICLCCLRNVQAPKLTRTSQRFTLPKIHNCTVLYYKRLYKNRFPKQFVSSGT